MEDERIAAIAAREAVIASCVAKKRIGVLLVIPLASTTSLPFRSPIPNLPLQEPATILLRERYVAAGGAEHQRFNIGHIRGKGSRGKPCLRRSAKACRRHRRR